MRIKIASMVIGSILIIANYYWFLPENNSCSNPVEGSGFPTLLIVTLGFWSIASYSIARWFRKKKLGLSVILGLLCFFSNYALFTDRVSCWATFTFSEEIVAVLSGSLLFILTSVGIFLCINVVLERFEKGFRY